MMTKVGDAEGRPPVASGDARTPIEDRIGDIERRLAALEAIAVVDETSIDRVWVDEEGGRASQSHLDARHLRRALQAALDAHGRSAARISANADVEAGSGTAAPVNALPEPDWALLWEAAAAMADVPSDGVADLRVKAHALLLLCEEKSEDVVHRLASGIARDILARDAPSDRGRGD